MAKKFPNIETLKVYQKGGDNQDVKKCPEATTDTEVNIDNRERSIARANYSRADSEDKCGNCIFFDISGRMKKCMETKSNNEGYCWDQEFVCSSENICDMWEEGGPIKSNNSSYLKDESYESEYEQNKQEVEEIQTTKQMPIAGQEQQQEMSPEVMQQMMAQQGPPQGPPQAMAPPPQAPPQQQMQPSYAYGGSLKRAQQQEETIEPPTILSFKDWVLQDPINRQGPNAHQEWLTYKQSINTKPKEEIDPSFGANKEAEIANIEKELIKTQVTIPDCIKRGGTWNDNTNTCEGLDDNTDIFDAQNKEEGNTLKDKYKDWRTKRGNRRRERSLNQDQNFIPWNAPPEQGIPGQIANWFKSVGHDFSNYDVDPNKITNREFRNYKRLLREQNPDMSRKEIKNLAKSVFPSHGNNRWGKENYQQFKVTNPFDDHRFFDVTNPDELITLDQKNARAYNKFAHFKTTTYPELYQKSTMGDDGEIIYTGDKLLGDIYETEYMPEVQMIQYNEDGTGIMGGNFFTGVDDKGVKQYQYIPFDPENPTNIIYTNPKGNQQNKNECFKLEKKCREMVPPGKWIADECKCKGANDQSKENENMDDKNIDDIIFDPTVPKQYGGSSPSFPFLRDGGDLTMFQNQSEYNWTDKQIKEWIEIQNSLVRPRTSYIDDAGNYQSSADFNPNTAQSTTLWDPRNVDLTNRSTWPSGKYSEFDPEWSEINKTQYPWLPDFTTEEGRSAAYNLHQAANTAYPDATAGGLHMPGTYWGNNPEGNRELYPYLNESVTDKSLRTGTYWETNPTDQYNEFLTKTRMIDNPYWFDRNRSWDMSYTEDDVEEHPFEIEALDLIDMKDISPETWTYLQNNPEAMEKVMGSIMPNFDNKEDAINFVNTMKGNPFGQNVQVNGQPFLLDSKDKVSQGSGRYNQNLTGKHFDFNQVALMEDLKEDWEDYVLTAGFGKVTDGQLSENQKSDGALTFEDYLSSPTAQEEIANYEPVYMEVTKDNVGTAFRDMADLGDNRFFSHLSGWGGGAKGHTEGTGHTGYYFGDDENRSDETYWSNPYATAGERNPEMQSLMWMIPAAVAGAAAWSTIGAPTLSYLSGLSVPGTSGALTLGNVANAGFAGNAIVNRLPQAYTDYQNEDYGNMVTNLGIGALEMSGVGNMGYKTLPKNFSQVSKYNPSFPALNTKGAQYFDDTYKNFLQANKQTPTFNINPFSKQPTQFSQMKDFATTDFSKYTLNPVFQAPKLNTTTVVPKKYGGSLPKAQNGAQDVAALYMVNPNQFDYETNMPKEGAISAYGDVWQGGAWVDATEEEQGFTTPDSDQFDVVGDAFSTDGTPTPYNTSNPFAAGAMNQNMKTAAADTYNVRRKDIDGNTWNPEEGAINKSYGDIWNNETGWTSNQFTPQFDQTDDFAFKGPGNTLSKGQLRDVRRENRRYDRRLAKAEKKGFESWDEMQAAKEEEKTLKKQRRKDKRDRWGDTFGERLGNKFNYMMDSKAMQTYGKVGQALVKGAGIVNDIFDARREKDAQDELLVSRSADDVYGVTSADALSRGEHDENTGIFQPDDKVISRWGKYGIELPRAQTGISTAGPLFDMNGRCFAGCAQRVFEPRHNLSLGIKSDFFKTDDDYNAGMGLWGGYTLNPDYGRRQEGLKAFLGANAGATLGNLNMENIENNIEPTINPYINALTTLGYEGEVGDAGSYANYLRGRRGDPLKWGLGAFGKYDLQGDNGLTVGGYGHYGNLGVNAGYNPNTGWSGNLSLGIPIRKDGGEKEQKTINVNSDMYYELIAAGADLEII